MLLPGIFPLVLTILECQPDEYMKGVTSSFTEDNLVSADGAMSVYHLTYVDSEKLSGKSLSLQILSSSGIYSGDVQLSDIVASRVFASDVTVAKEVYDHSYLSLNMSDLSDMKRRYLDGDYEARTYVNEILSVADKEVSSDNVYTIINKTIMPPSGDIHDYVTMAPYWWPDPTKPDGIPYIYKDGQINPETRTGNTDEKALEGVRDAVQNLGLAYYFTGNTAYVTKISQLVDAFFIDEETKMNPNLNYSQYIKGRNDNMGSNAGIIITAGIGKMLEGFNLACKSGLMPQSVIDGLRKWTAEYANWLKTSELGIAESQTTNNHGTHYDRQLISLLLFTDDIESARTQLETTKKRVLAQVKTDGSQPEELKRTKSWNYTNMNMEGFYLIGLMADKIGVDMWNYKGDREKAPYQAMIDWFLPYLAKEKTWGWQQIQEEPISKIEWCLEIAAQKYNDQKYLRAIDNFQTIHENIVK